MYTDLASMHGEDWAVWCGMWNGKVGRKGRLWNVECGLGMVKRRRGLSLSWMYVQHGFMIQETDQVMISLLHI